MELIENGVTRTLVLDHYLELHNKTLREKVFRIENHKGVWTLSLNDYILLNELMDLINFFNKNLFYDHLNIEINGFTYEYIAGCNQDRIYIAELLRHGVR